MRPKLKIRRGDHVIVIAGRNKGIKGNVTKVFPEENKVIVEGVNVVYKHMRPSATRPEGGIVPLPSKIHVSNIQHVDPSSGKPTRVGYKVSAEGKKVRFAKKSGDIIEVK
jgi:large subunit ribosomal protein L24